jgi:tRNA threonylcarbamoyladenosine biosynthesis protein TsaB
MKILAVEFSSEQRSVAIWADGAVRGSAGETATRATHAIALIEQALAQAGLKREQLDCLAVGLSPGSYTGIRAAIALAQGWQLARPVKLLGLTSIECLVAEARAAGWNGRVNFVIDAQRNELYLARYDISPQSAAELEPLKLASLEEVRSRIAAGEMVAGPEVTRWFPQGRTLVPEAATLARLAETRTDFVAGESLEPIYLRETNFVKAPPPRFQQSQ